jgi:hypothetical protein
LVNSAPPRYPHQKLVPYLRTLHWSFSHQITAQAPRLLAGHMSRFPPCRNGFYLSQTLINKSSYYQSTLLGSTAVYFRCKSKGAQTFLR